MNRYRSLHSRSDRLNERGGDPRGGLAIWSSLSRPDAHTGCFPVAASLEFKGELKRWPMLSMVCDEECLVAFHGLCQLHKIGLRELSRQEICPAIRLHCILHHPLVVIC